MPEYEDVLRKLEALWQRADHPNTPPAERESCINKAREMMVKYQISELELSAATTTEDAVVLSDILIFTSGETTLVPDQRIYLAHTLGVHNGCKSVIQQRPASIDANTGMPTVGGTYLVTVGYRSDVDKVRKAYELFGTFMVFALSEEFGKLSHLTKREQGNYSANFCDGYIERLDERFGAIDRDVEQAAEFHEGGSLLPALRSRKAAVEDVFNEMFPNLKKQYTSRYAHDPNACARGRAAADRADMGAGKVGGGSKGQVGGPRKEIGS